MKYQVNNKEEGIRIDNYLMEKSGISRNQIQRCIKESKVKVNDKDTKNSYNVHENDIITLEYAEREIKVEPEKMDIDIVYEDQDLLVINKRNGVVVHPAIGNTEGTLVNGLMYYTDLSEDDFRPGIVHRIDAYTTGLIVVAKNNMAHDSLAQQLKEHTVHRKYQALVWGVINNNTGTIDAPIGRCKRNRKMMDVVEDGKESITHFTVLERFKEATLIELKLETGRTHQIRVHMNYIGYPVVNDPVYGHKKLIDETGQCLHAKELGFVHPRTHEFMMFNSELPECFTNILNQFK